MASSDTPRLRVTFLDEDVSALAEIDWTNAATTATAIVQALPITGDAFHGIYSGSEIACFIPTEISLPTENATTRVLPGDLAYYRVRGGETYGYPNDLSEVCWFYDRDARPSTADGPVAVNVFARFTDGWAEFSTLSRRMRREGSKVISIDFH